MGRTVWRGVTLDQRSADMMDAVNELLPHVPVNPTQGSYNGGGVAASAGTHDGGGSIDCAARDLTPQQRDDLVYVMRRVGWAAWLRTPAQSDWPWHVHGIAVQPGGRDDQGVLSRGAWDQVKQYYDGTNGLAGRGRDDGPRQFVGVTWETYQASNPEPEKPRRRRTMILVTSPQGLIHLVSLSGPAHVATPEALAEIHHALQDPTYSAIVDQGTWDNMVAYAAPGAV